MNKIANRAVMCEVLKEAAAKDKDVVVLCSDSRGSASLTSFADTYPDQFVEVGIAEQNLVSIAAGLASCGKKAYAASPASFISTRSYEQCKVDCAYSGTNVKLIGISGGVSYGALGMTHHSAQDIAAMSAIPGMRVYLPSDRHQTRKLFEDLLKDNQTAYIRLGDGIRSDGTVHDSMNHYAYGAICGWLLDSVCGIRLKDGKLTIRPYPHPSLGYAKARWNSPVGLIESEWRYEGSKLHLRVQTPIRAEIQWPDGRMEAVSNGVHWISPRPRTLRHW